MAIFEGLAADQNEVRAAKAEWAIARLTLAGPSAVEAFRAAVSK